MVTVITMIKTREWTGAGVGMSCMWRFTMKIWWYSLDLSDYLV